MFGRPRPDPRDELLREVRSERDRLLMRVGYLEARLAKAQDDLLAATNPKARWNVNASREAEEALKAPPRPRTPPLQPDLPPWIDTMHDHMDVGAALGHEFQRDNPADLPPDMLEQLKDLATGVRVPGEGPPPTDEEEPS